MSDEPRKERAATKSMKTAIGFAQEVLERHFNAASSRDFNECAELIEARDTEIRQACAAEYQPRIDDLKAAIEAAVMDERKMWQGRESEGYRQHLLQRVTDADAIIDEARKLASEWRHVVKTHKLQLKSGYGDGRDDQRTDCADELLAILDKKAGA